MKKLKNLGLLLAGFVMAIVAMMANVPTKAQTRNCVATASRIKIVHDANTQRVTADLACPAMIFRNINDYKSVIAERA